MAARPAGPRAAARPVICPADRVELRPDPFQAMARRARRIMLRRAQLPQQARALQIVRRAVLPPASFLTRRQAPPAATEARVRAPRRQARQRQADLEQALQRVLRRTARLCRTIAQHPALPTTIRPTALQQTALQQTALQQTAPPQAVLQQIAARRQT